jgi:probable rRNA maturation factor
MDQGSINFYNQSISFTLPQKKLVRQWLHTTAKKEGHKIHQLNFIFCSDKDLLQINRNYLKHDTLTDIITFGLSGRNEPIEGEIYISVERVHENAKAFDELKSRELKRVMVHGLLHLIGYKDKTKIDALTMRKKEDTYINLWVKISNS